MFHCPKCQSGFKKEAELRKHYLTDHMHRIVMQQKLDVEIELDKLLVESQVGDQAEFKFRCPKCQQMFKQEIELRRHYSAEHMHRVVSQQKLYLESTLDGLLANSHKTGLVTNVESLQRDSCDSDSDSLDDGVVRQSPLSAEIENQLNANLESIGSMEGGHCVAANVTTPNPTVGNNHHDYRRKKQVAAIRPFNNYRGRGSYNQWNMSSVNEFNKQENRACGGGQISGYPRPQSGRGMHGPRFRGPLPPAFRGPQFGSNRGVHQTQMGPRSSCKKQPQDQVNRETSNLHKNGGFFGSGGKGKPLFPQASADKTQSVAVNGNDCASNSVGAEKFPNQPQKGENANVVNDENQSSTFMTALNAVKAMLGGRQKEEANQPLSEASKPLSNEKLQQHFFKQREQRKLNKIESEREKQQRDKSIIIKFLPEKPTEEETKRDDLCFILTICNKAGIGRKELIKLERMGVKREGWIRMLRVETTSNTTRETFVREFDRCRPPELNPRCVACPDRGTRPIAPNPSTGNKGNVNDQK